MFESSDPWTPLGLRPHRLGGRWTVGPEIGRGANGVVYQGVDEADGAEVAIKMLAPLSTDQRARVRREIAALRILRLPGVVQMLDDGEEDGSHYIVMERVRGTWFPGAMADLEWASLAPRAAALLQALGRVHAAGILHRDVKPANVLVDDAGQVHLLDFGLARGALLGETVTMTDAFMGTLRYAAPEQLCGGAVDLRADLYAVGVMLYEQLTDEIPHGVPDREAFMVARAAHDVAPIDSLRPDLPREAVRLVDALLRREPADRPRSALEALALLGGARARPRFPRLGGDAPVHALVACARRGASCGIAGGPGSGKTRVLQEAAEILEAEGREVVWAAPGTRPFESLAFLVGQPEDVGDAAAELGDRLVARLAGGTILVVDPPDRLDRWSRDLLQRAQGAGTVLGLGRTVVTLEPLDEEALRPLFAGPQRLQHLPEDAARELYRRAGGVPARVVAEVDAWMAAHLAHPDGERVAIDRSALERLVGGLRVEPALLEQPRQETLDATQAALLGWVGIAWPHATTALLLEATGRRRWELEFELAELQDQREVRQRPDGSWEPTGGVARALAGLSRPARVAAHGTMARLLEPGADGRLAHLVAAHDLRGAVDEAIRVGQQLAAAGNFPRAIGTFEIGLLVARQLDGAPGEEALLLALAHAAIASLSLAALDRAALEVGRAVNDSERLERCAALMAAWKIGMQGDRAEAARLLRALGPVEPPPLEECRLTELLRMLSTTAPGDADALLDRLEEDAEDGRRRGLCAGWRGSIAYRREQYEDAAALHKLAACALGGGAEHLRAVFARATALLDGGHFADARTVAEAALAKAAGLRDPYLEARAEWIRRSAAYRAGEALEVDDELVAAAIVSVHEWMTAQVLLTEAATAWRIGDPRGKPWAEQAHALWASVGFVPGATLMAALALAITPAPAPRALLDAALACPIPGLAVQSLGLLAYADPTCRGELAPRVAALLLAIPGQLRSVRHEILAPEEALSYCRA